MQRLISRSTASGLQSRRGGEIEELVLPADLRTEARAYTLAEGRSYDTMDRGFDTNSTVATCQVSSHMHTPADLYWCLVKTVTMLTVTLTLAVFSRRTSSRSYTVL